MSPTDTQRQTESYAREPRGRCFLNKQEVTGWLSLEVDSNAFMSADTFRVVFAQSHLPDEFDIDWFSRQTTFRVEIQFDDGVNGMQTWLVGDADSLQFDPTARTITLEGRDLTALLSDRKTSCKWRNLTASQIVERIAAGLGFEAVVTATSAKAGSYYQIDHVQVQDEMSEWDLLCYLARREEFVCHVRGECLYFEPIVKSGTVTPYRIEWRETESGPVSTAKSLRFERALTLSRGVEVRVASFNVRQKQGFTVVYPPGKGGSKGAGNKAVRPYHFTFPNLTREAALQKAKSLYGEITRHEMKLEVTLPGDNLLTPQDVIEVVGTDSEFDQYYYADSVRRSFDVGSGYSMTVSAKNHNPATQGGSE